MALHVSMRTHYKTRQRNFCYLFLLMGLYCIIFCLLVWLKKHGSTCAPDADDRVFEGLLTPTHCSSQKTRKRRKKTKKKKKKKKNTHLHFASSDAEESASVILPLSVPVSLSGGSVESDNG